MSTTARRILVTMAGVLLILASGVSATSASAAVDRPRVVVIVGPVGELTDSYRAVGRSAAREAARWTSDVLTVTSPNATWRAVREALQGASIVVYLGHGNGFPSPYRSEPYPRTQNGLGLNPVAGGDDTAHQYFGESFLSREVRLAPHAVVILSRLCYASGNPEPGGRQPTVDVATQRADNFAAGWLAAGAQAVVADALGRPDEYIRRLFVTGLPVERLWRTAGTYHDNVIVGSSKRTPGATVLLDPSAPDRDFYRSLVSLDGAPSVNRVGPRSATGIQPRPVVPVAPSLAALGVAAGVPTLEATEQGGELVVGRQASLTLPIKVPAGTILPADLRLGVRWQPLDPPTRPTGPSPSGGGSGPSVAPPPIELVAPEQPGTIVASAPALSNRDRLKVTVALPAEPGRYRLTTTIHDGDDVAFDARTQALVAPLVVRVSQPVSVAYGLEHESTVQAGLPFDLRLRLANNGSLPWADPPVSFDSLTGLGRYNPAPSLIARWIATDGLTGQTTVVAMTGPRLGPGETTVVTIQLTAPRIVGSYIILVDVISPLHGSLAAAGGAFGEIRITVKAVDASGY